MFWGCILCGAPCSPTPDIAHALDMLGEQWRTCEGEIRTHLCPWGEMYLKCCPFADGAYYRQSWLQVYAMHEGGRQDLSTQF